MSKTLHGLICIKLPDGGLVPVHLQGGVGGVHEAAGEDHQLWGGDGGSFLKSDDPPLQVQSNQRGSPLLPSYQTPVLIILALVCVGRGGTGSAGDTRVFLGLKTRYNYEQCFCQ